jgi:hypothetical protein
MMIMLTSATTASAGCRGNLVTLTNLDLIPVNLALKNSDTYSEYITCYFPSGMMWDYRYPSNFRVSRRPLHGVAGVNNGATGSGFAYKPADGYIGHDSFEVSLDDISTKTGDKRVVVIRVDADVTK